LTLTYHPKLTALAGAVESAWKIQNAKMAFSNYLNQRFMRKYAVFYKH
jgi:hypothetical protein